MYVTEWVSEWKRVFYANKCACFVTDGKSGTNNKISNAQCNSQSFGSVHVSGPLFNPMSHSLLHVHDETGKWVRKLSYTPHICPMETHTHTHTDVAVWLLANRTFYSCVTTMWSIVYSRLPCEQPTIERQCLKLVRVSVFFHQSSIYCTCKQNLYIVVIERESLTINLSLFAATQQFIIFKINILSFRRSWNRLWLVLMPTQSRRSIDFFMDFHFQFCAVCSSSAEE